MIIQANELKRKGVSFIEKLMQQDEEVFISVRGKTKYVIIPVEKYEQLKDAELESVVRQAEKDYKEGRYRVETAEEHFRRLGI